MANKNRYIGEEEVDGLLNVKVERSFGLRYVVIADPSTRKAMSVEVWHLNDDADGWWVERYKPAQRKRIVKAARCFV